MIPYINKLINVEEEINLPCRRIPNNICRNSALENGEPNSPLLRCRLCVVTSFQRIQYEGAGGCSKVETADKHDFGLMIKGNLNSHKPC